MLSPARGRCLITTTARQVRATAGRAYLTGAMDEASIRDGVAHTLQISLDDAYWTPNFFTEVRLRLLKYLPSDHLAS